MKSLEILTILPFEPSCSLKNLCSNSNNGRHTFGAKQNLHALLVAPDQERIKRTILHGFDPLLPSPSPSSVGKIVRPEVPARPLPRNQESRGR
jgi:hypothetical protein